MHPVSIFEGGASIPSRVRLPPVLSFIEEVQRGLGRRKDPEDVVATVVRVVGAEVVERGVDYPLNVLRNP